MEEKILELLKVLNKVNGSQDKIFAEIKYTADDSKKIEIDIRKKESFKYIEKCDVSLAHYSEEKLDAIINILKKYVGGAGNE